MVSSIVNQNAPQQNAPAHEREEALIDKVAQCAQNLLGSKEIASRLPIGCVPTTTLTSRKQPIRGDVIKTGSSSQTTSQSTIPTLTHSIRNERPNTNKEAERIAALDARNREIVKTRQIIENQIVNKSLEERSLKDAS